MRFRRTAKYPFNSIHYVYLFIQLFEVGCTIIKPARRANCNSLRTHQRSIWFWRWRYKLTSCIVSRCLSLRGPPGERVYQLKTNYFLSFELLPEYIMSTLMNEWKLNERMNDRNEKKSCALRSLVLGWFYRRSTQIFYHHLYKMSLPSPCWIPIVSYASTLTYETVISYVREGVVVFRRILIA